MTPEALAIFKSTPGAVSVHEAFAISWLASIAPKDGTCVTLGSHAGKDAIAACSGIARKAFDYHAVDPVYDLENRAAWAESVQGAPENMPWIYVAEPDFNAKVKARLVAASEGKCTPILQGMSAKQWLRLQFSNSIAYLFSDADDHNREQILAEMSLAAPLMVPGGIVVFHDFGNYTGPVAAHAELLDGGGWESVGIPWAALMADAALNGGESGNNSWHCCDNPAPRFVGALRRK